MCVRQVRKFKDGGCGVPFNFDIEVFREIDKIVWTNKHFLMRRIFAQEREKDVYQRLYVRF